MLMFSVSFFLLVGSSFSMVLIGQEQVPKISTEKKYSSCQEALEDGYSKSGLFSLQLESRPDDVFEVFCNFSMPEVSKGHRNQRAAVGATTTILYRYYGKENFQRSYNDYRKGFGSPKTDYFYGLDNIYQLVIQGNKVLTITIQDWNGNTKTAKYTNFAIGSFPDYTLSIGGFSGSAGLKDDMSFQNGRKFSTIDKPDPHNCVLNQKAGWWYNYCAYALLTGRYYVGGSYVPAGTFADGIYWQSWMGYNYSFKYISVTLSNR